MTRFVTKALLAVGLPLFITGAVALAAETGKAGVEVVRNLSRVPDGDIFRHEAVQGVDKLVKCLLRFGGKMNDLAQGINPRIGATRAVDPGFDAQDRRQRLFELRLN